MNEQSIRNFSVLDQPRVLMALFHPRKEDAGRPIQQNREDIQIPVDPGVEVGASFHRADKKGPVILFFHGNGEIVSDYDEFGRLYTDMGINFLVVDYRGYGRSGGRPSVTSMMMDCQKIFDFTRNLMKRMALTGPLCVMGRSLGSASAIELCSTRPNEVDRLIIESGFARVSPLLQTLGIDPRSIGFKEQQGFENIDKIKTFTNPCLLIHAQFDHIIPFLEGQALFDACGSTDKELLKINGANHNDIFFKGMDPYLAHVRQICFDPILP